MNDWPEPDTLLEVAPGDDGSAIAVRALAFGLAALALFLIWRTLREGRRG